MAIQQAYNPGIPADMRKCSVRVSGLPMQWFIPEGPFIYATASNPPEVTSKSALSRTHRATQAARFAIGFNVGIKQKWTMPKIIRLVHRIRREQVKRAFDEGYAVEPGHGGDIGASFIAQKGLWQTVDRRKDYPENGAQVVIINNISEKHREFRQDMEYLAETLATELEQDAVLVEHQSRGVVIETVLYGSR